MVNYLVKSVTIKYIVYLTELTTIVYVINLVSYMCIKKVCP